MRKRVLLVFMVLLVALTPLATAKSKPVKKVELSYSSLTLEKDASQQLYAVFSPDGSSAPIQWKSSDPKVATVDNSGVVTAVGPGTASIQVKTKNGKTAKCAVTVPDPDKVIAFTFDDGPVANTSKLLDVLKANDVHATFFMLGDNVDANPSIAKAVSDAGNVIGSHSVNHPNLKKLSLEDAKWQVSHSFDSIEAATGKRPTLMRAPYGSIDNDLAQALDVTFVNWMGDTEDWKDRDANTVYTRIMEMAKPGRIMLMHDLYETTTEAVKKAIPALKKQGYTFVTVPELLEIRGLGETRGTIIF